MEPLEVMLSTGFLGSAAGQVEICQPLILCLFGSSANSLISLVLGNDGSDASSLTLLIGSCLKETSLGCQF